MEILLALREFAAYVSIQHVLVLFLMGAMIKGTMHHKGLGNWTDIIPCLLMVLGVLLAVLDPIKYEGHFIIYGLANAGLAWLLHRIIKDGGAFVKQIGKNK